MCLCVCVCVYIPSCWVHHAPPLSLEWDVQFSLSPPSPGPGHRSDDK